MSLNQWTVSPIILFFRSSLSGRFHWLHWDNSRVKGWITHKRPVEDQTLGSKKDSITFDRFHFTVSFILPFYNGDQIFSQVRLCSICSSLTLWTPVKTVFCLFSENYSRFNFKRWWQINGIDLNVLTFTHCEQRYASVLELSQWPCAFTDMANWFKMTFVPATVRLWVSK